MDIQHQLIDIASRDVICLSVDDPIGEAARIMSQRRFSSIVITDETRHPVGIVTERNILHAMRVGYSPQTQLQTCMSSPVIVMPGTSNALDAYQSCLRQGIRHLVLVDDAGEVAGLVSETDFRLHLNLTALAGRRQVMSVAHSTVTSLPGHSSLLQALNLMQAQHESCVVVVENDKPVGIVTERDVVRFYAREPERVEVPLFELMTSPVLTIPADATINQAAETMLERKVRHLSVVNEEGLMVGLVSEHDLTQTMASGLLDEKFEVDEIFLRTFIDAIPDLVWLKDKDGVFMSCNRSFAQMVGVSEADIVGKSDYELVGKEQADYFREHDLKAMAADKPSINEEWLTFAADGHQAPFETVKTPMRDRQGQLVGILGVARDVSGRDRSERALLESERQYRTLAENTPDNIIRYDSQCRVLYMNQALVKSLAPEALPVLGAISSETHPNYVMAKAIRQVVEQVIATGERAEMEIPVPHPNGELRTHHIIYVAERGTSGEIVGALGIGRDITQRKHTDKQLEEYRQRLEGLVAEESTKFRALVEQSLVGIYIIQDDVFRYGNPGLVKMFGYDSQDEIVDTIPVYRFIREEDRSLVDENIRKRIRGEVESMRYSFTALKRDGTEMIVDAYGRRIEYQGRPAIIGTLVDITEMRRSKEELHRLVEEKSSRLQQSEELLRTLIEAIPDAIEFKDGDGRWLESNSAARAAFGLNVETASRRTDVELAEIADPSYRSALLRCYETDQQAWEVGKTSRVEEVMQIPEVGKMTFDVIKVPLFHGDGSRKGLVIVGRDVTELKRAEDALRSSVENYSGLVQRIPVGVYKLRMRADGTSGFDYVSPRWCEQLDVSEAEVMRGEPVARARILPEEIERFARLNEEARQDMCRFEWEGRIRRRSGELRWLHIESQPTLLENGDILWDGIQYDITDRRMAEDTLRVTASVFDNSQEAIVITDANNCIIDANPAFTIITGYYRDEVLGKDPKFLSSGRQDAAFYASMWGALRARKAWRGEIWNRRKNGEVYAELLSISAICDPAGNVQRHVAVFSDITYFKEHEAELSQVANYDALTGVPNRRLLADRLRQSIAHAQRSGKMMAVCYIDLDGFKDVNDQYGHETGDRLLMDIADRLQEVLRAGDTLARLGGDEFVVLFNGLTADEECYQVLERIMLAIATPTQLGGQKVAVSASIGVTFYPADDEDGDTLLRHADQAMYIAKQTGKNRYHLYDAVHDQRVRTMHESRRRILQGLENGEFELYYQPKLELSSNRIVGVEALIRWNHPERGLLQPADFLPVIESSDLECKLGRWVLGAALDQLHEWEKAGVSMEISINISARHLQSPDFVAELKSKLGQYPKLEHGRLQIEVLETAALEDTSQTFEIIRECRDLGVSFALDDFGTGYSSLVYLRRLGADTLKIDQSFVQNMATNEGDRAIVEGVIALAKTFKRETVAEGMEDPALVQKLAQMGCGFGQGYGIAYPMPAGEFLDWYKKR
jgi:diguanylate cyclase (GGDEF)-like protein/PAS domain S-box-containing protein